MTRVKENWLMYKEVEQIIISIISIQSDTHVFVSKKIQLGISIQKWYTHVFVSKMMQLGISIQKWYSCICI